jgi:Xaa-Pro aminopeptidase
MRGVTLPDFKARRDRALARLGPGALVFFSAPFALRNNDVEHEWRQHSDFHFLTGFDEPESVAVIRNDPSPRFVLFVRPRDPEREVWDGPRAGVEGAVSDFGADEAHPIGELGAKLPSLFENVSTLCYELGRERSNDDKVLEAIENVRRRARRGIGYPRAIVDPAGVLHELRLKKEPDELALMRRAAEITEKGHREVMKKTQPGMFEYEAEAVLRAVFRTNGAERHAYPPIVASGANSTILHYRKNDRRMLDGDLLLVDAGSEYGYYASDVTRTFPVNGRFSAPQRAVYDIVLAAELEAIRAVKVGASIEDVHAVAVRIVTQGLIDLGVIQGPLDQAIQEERHKPWFMHRTSHWLGMDVHDVGGYHLGGASRSLEPGMVLTVEPGLYFGAADERVPGELRGIGIRIEDDVAVTDGAPLVLTESIPKRIDDIERACAA